jgi:hypothetical protein
MTPCESRGWREGDVFIIKDNYGCRYFKIGDEVVLYKDDATTSPWFKGPEWVSDGVWAVDYDEVELKHPFTLENK